MTLATCLDVASCLWMRRLAHLTLRLWRENKELEDPTEFQRSLTHHGFSSFSIEMAASFGRFTIAGGVSAGLRAGSERVKCSVNAKKHKDYFVSYDFRHIKMFLDDAIFELTPA